MITCSVCSRDDLAAVDLQLRSGTPTRAVAKTFGLSKSAVARHKARCLAPATARPVEHLAADDYDRLIESAKANLSAAEAKGSIPGIDAATRTLANLLRDRPAAKLTPKAHAPDACPTCGRAPPKGLSPEMAASIYQAVLGLSAEQTASAMGARAPADLRAAMDPRTADRPLLDADGVQIPERRPTIFAEDVLDRDKLDRIAAKVDRTRQRFDPTDVNAPNPLDDEPEDPFDDKFFE